MEDNYIKKYKCILLSNTIINKYKLNNIRELFIYPSRSKDVNLEYGILLCIESKIINYLESLTNKYLRIKFINSEFFIKNIKSKCLLICKDNICELWELFESSTSKYRDSGYIIYMLNDIYNHLNTNNITLWCSINFKDTQRDSKIINLLINSGFHNPYICNRSPFGSELKDKSICMYKDNHKVQKHITLNILKYIYKYNNLRYKYCFMNAKFTKNAIEYLKHIPFNKSNEMAGALTITNNKFRDYVTPEISKFNYDIIFYIDIINESKIEGNSEYITLQNDKYNFHSHPIDAYIKYNVDFGWPSGQDYIGFLEAIISVKCIFHVVTTKEGVYIISLSKEYARNSNLFKKSSREINNLKREIGTKYNIAKTDFDSPYYYIEYVNNKLKIFHVKFLEWKNVNSEFIVYFPKYNNNCIV